MVYATSRKRAAAQAVALTLLLPVVTYAATSMDHVPLPVPRPAWLNAISETETSSPASETQTPADLAPADWTPTRLASLPSSMPLPVARPHWLDAAGAASTHMDEENHAAPQLQPNLRMTRVPLPVPRPDWLDATTSDTQSERAADSETTRVAKSQDEEPRKRNADQARSPLHAMIDDYARHHGVPLRLAHRIVQQESRYNPTLKAKAHFGLMQVSHPTARSMGYTGDIPGLLDAKTNLTYAMPYLANAWIVSGGNEEKARRLYMSGYYPEAKRKGLLKELRRADSPPVAVEQDAAAVR